MSESRVALRFFGDDLVPEEVTRLLNASPSASARKGDAVRMANGLERTAGTGSWIFRTEDVLPGDLDVQVGQIFGQMTKDLSVWRSLSKRFRADLFCGLFLDEGIEGIGLLPDTTTAIGARGLTIDFDIYADSAKNDLESPASQA